MGMMTDDSSGTVGGRKTILAIIAAFVLTVVIAVIMATDRGAKPAPTAQKETAGMAEQTNRVLPVQTARLAVRPFTPDDWKALQQLALDKKNTGGDRYDHAWPTDDKGAQAMAEWCVGPQCFAVCLKDGGELIGFVRFNGIDDKGRLNLGHVFHSSYRGEGYASEAVRPLLAIAFADAKVNGVVARNAVEWPGQLAPLIELGFRELERSDARNFDGTEGGFVACLMGLTRAEWKASTRAFSMPHRND